MEPSAPPPLLQKLSCIQRTGREKNVPELALSLKGWGEGDGIVEGQTKCVVCFVTALVVEQIVLKIVTDGEERAAGRICGGVHAVGASDTFGDGS